MPAHHPEDAGAQAGHRICTGPKLAALHKAGNSQANNRGSRKDQQKTAKHKSTNIKTLRGARALFATNDFMKTYDRIKGHEIKWAKLHETKLKYLRN